jgi:hypothetical protein
MSATNKWLLISESPGDSNRHTPCRGKTWPTRHVCFSRQSTYTQWTLPAGGPRTWQPFASHQQRWMNPTGPEKKGSRHNPQPGWVIRRSATQFLSQHSYWNSNESQTSVDTRLLGLPGSYHRHAIGTFNTCSQVSAPQSLTDTGRGYHKGNLGIAKTLSPPFPFKGSTNPLMALPGLRLFTTITNLTREGTSPKSREWEPPLDFYRNLPSKHSITNDKPPHDGGNKDKLEGRSQCIYGAIQLL